MPSKRERPPLLFIVQDSETYPLPKSSKDYQSFAIASHVASRYNRWTKRTRKGLRLDATTKAILAPKAPVPKPSSASPTATTTTTSLSAASEEEEDEKGNLGIGKPRGSERQVVNNHWFALAESSARFPASARKAPSEKAWEGALLKFEEFVSTRLSNLGSQFLDPFVSLNYDAEIKANLYFYFNTIRPFATHVIPTWNWCGSLSQIQASPVLTYAVATFASIFLSGMLRGGPGVVLPPPTEKGQKSKWPIPPWLRLHTKCLVELNAILRDPSESVDESCYHAVLFLYRLSLLLADGESGRMHFQGLRRISTLLGYDEAPLETELAVTKVNIIGAYLHSSSIVLVRKHDTSHHNGHPPHVRSEVEIDRHLWPSEREWFSHRAHLAGRVLAWRSESPSADLQPESALAIARMDPQSSLLHPLDLQELQRCYQISVFFWMHLNAISFNTSALIIRSNLLELQNRLSSNMDLFTMSSVCYTTLFNILLAGTNAAYGHPERWWFVRKIIQLYPDVQSLDTTYQLVADFFDPLALNFNVLQDIWDDVVRVRGGFGYGDLATNAQENSLPSNKVVRPVKHYRPTTYTPDLKKPTVVLEIEKGEEDSLEDRLHKVAGDYTGRQARLQYGPHPGPLRS
ncbi:hypothetical protein LTR46_009676 [Exophiala xenobiotica]|nr:hypothetical protein LTR18_001238 [Exophiala xenobiotica]KAK5552347.1 hypothetical protein LTR46_009676 [Exophiala xenobiotica]